MVVTKSKEPTLKQLEKIELSKLHKEYLGKRKNIIEEYNLMKLFGKYKILVFRHRKAIHLLFDNDSYYIRYGKFKPTDKNLVEKLLELYPPEPLYYHKSTFTGIYREGDDSIKESGITELIFPIYFRSKDNVSVIEMKWKTATHDISIEFDRHKLSFSEITPSNKINYSGGDRITYFPYREDLNILEYINDGSN